MKTFEYQNPVIQRLSEVANPLWSVAAGEIPGAAGVFKFGENPSVSATEQVVWDGTGNYTFLEAAEAMEIVSTDADDNPASTGAHTMIVFGLDSNWDDVSEVVTLNGTTPVTTSQEFLRVYRAHIITSGNPNPIGNANEGDITITGATSSTLQAKILAGNGQTLMCVYTIPAGKTGLITGATFAVGEGKTCNFKGKFRNGVGGAFSVKYAIPLFESSFFGTFENPLVVPEKIDIVITAQSTASGTRANASFGLVLIDNN